MGGCDVFSRRVRHSKNGHHKQLPLAWYLHKKNPNGKNAKTKNGSGKHDVA
jgi:hypothetical protein